MHIVLNRLYAHSSISETWDERTMYPFTPEISQSGSYHAVVCANEPLQSIWEFILD